MAEFAINNSVHVSTGHTPFYVDALRHPRAGPVVNKDAELNNGFSSKAMDFVQRRQAVIRFVQDAIAASVDRQKLNADINGRGNSNEFKVGSLVLIATQNLAKHAVSDFEASLLAPRFIGPFTVLAKHGNAPAASSRRLHPHCEKNRGQFAGSSSEFLIIGSGHKFRIIFDFVGKDSSEPRYVEVAELPDAGRSENGDGVRNPPPPKLPKGVNLERELGSPPAPDRVLHPPAALQDLCAINLRAESSVLRAHEHLCTR
ncbi:unnamed protein product [Phytophthora fragariaefolia]|uniref:Unnamed protein product n=1 Tax=Phytophthora fragariaefolia TaxID=1490495 RepID=A0A9W7CQA6_9STRA|nr:unnamed protein product [Phytophthora fragariaefolia]